jgi:hypothetical protein
MGRPVNLNGGRKQTFPARQRDLIEDLKAINWRVEQVEASIARLTSKRDRLQLEGYELQEQIYQQALSHADAISGQSMPLCRAYAQVRTSEPAPAA